jgi:hypothetical protein
MESQQIMELLLATREDRKADKEEMLAEMKANQARADADRKAYREALKEMKAIIKAWSSDLEADHENRKETMACQGNMEARLEKEDKPASVDRPPEVAQEQEVPREDAIDMPVGEPRKRRRDRRHLAAMRRQKKKQDKNLDARRRRKQKKRTQNKDGCRKGLVAARRGSTRCAGRARRKENSIGRSWDKDNGVLRTSKGWPPERRQRAQQQPNRGIRVETYRKTTGLEIAKKITGSPVPSQTYKNWTLWRCRPPPKRKK